MAIHPKEHRYTVGEPRSLRKNEKALLSHMLNAKLETRALIASLEEALVQDMNDGGMGSLRFVGAPDRRFGSSAAEATFADEDGVPVSAAIFLDQYDALYELDMLKGNGSQLRLFPSPGKVVLTAPRE